MTSLAFVAGVVPLAIATGAGAGSQSDIGTGVIGGMLLAKYWRSSSSHRGHAGVLLHG
jgi:multidrug efflux pump